MTSASTIINLLIGYGAFQACFIAFILLRSGNRSLFKKLFAALLLIEGFTLLERLLVETGWMYATPHLLGISYPISFLKPPLLLAMAYAVTDSDFKIARKHYWHFTAFGLILLLNSPFYIMSGAEKLAWVNNFMHRIPSYRSFDFYFSLSFFAYIGIYIFFALRKLQQFRFQVVNNALANWYRIILLSYSGFLLLHLVYFLVQPLGQLNLALFNQVSLLAMTLIIQAIAFKIMDKSAILDTKAPDLGDLSKRKKHEDLIVAQFEQHKVHLDHDLNLQKFSGSISLAPTDVSKVINQKFNCSFKKLVAQYRVREAKSLIHNAKEEKVKLIDIAYQSGFNNKVSFYRAFKEFEQIAPSAYLEQAKMKENS